MKRILSLILVLILCFGVTAALSSCSEPEENEPVQMRDERIAIVYRAYEAQAEANGETPLDYDAWLESIRGKDGKDGKNGKDGKDGENGLVPSIGKNGNWYLGIIDTGVRAGAVDGIDGTDGVDGVTPHIGENKNWYIGNYDTGVKAEGVDGAAADKGDPGDTPYVGENGNWWIGDVDSGYAVVGNNGLSAYELAVLHGYVGTEEYWLDTLATTVDDTLSKQGYAADAKAVGDAVKLLADEIAHCFTEKQVTKTTKITPEMHSGYCSENGSTHANSGEQNYVYTDPIPVKKGDVVYVANSETMTKYAARFIIPFSGSTVVSSYVVAIGAGSSEPFEVPAGVDSLVFTLYGNSQSNRVICIDRTETVYELEQIDYTEVIKDMIGDSIQENVSIATTGAVGGSTMTKTAATLAAGQSIELERNSIMNQKSISFFCNLDSIGNGKIRVGHGLTEYGAYWVEIDKTAVTVYACYANAAVRNTYQHNLTVKDYLAVNINVGDKCNASVTISTGNGGASNGMYKIDYVYWEGRNGAPRCEAVDVNLSNVTLSFSCKAYANDLYAIGDSYFNFGDPSRWPYYLRENGYTDNLLIGFSGMNSTNGLRELQTALLHGTPKYVLWCMGMNDADSETAVNANWLSCVTQVVKLCEDRGITLILATIPNVPGRINDYKNDWVIASGYRYVDFAAAVGAKDHGDTTWFSGMLYTDNVHPTQLGAQALYMRALTDCPELMQ